MFYPFVMRQHRMVSSLELEVDCLRRAVTRAGPKTMRGQDDTVGTAPNDEIPRRAVPQTAQQHREKKISIGEDLAATISAERDVEVVAQPAR